MNIKSQSTVNLRSLSNQELDHSLMNWVKTEKRSFNNVLIHIAEVDRRKMYLDYAFPSLRAYLEERMGYDGGSAQRRIDAVRLSHAVPHVIESLHCGELKLSQVTVLQKSLREVKDQIITPEIKTKLVEAIKNKSVYETQSIVAKALNIEIKQAPKITAQADESMRFEISLSKTQWEKITRMRELLSHSVPSGDWATLLEYLSDKVIQKKTGKVTYQAVDKMMQQKVDQMPSQKPASLYQLKKQILSQDHGCQYKSKDGKVCGSRWALQSDHFQPKWAGGKDIPENLRALCGKHNRYIYRKQASIKLG